MNAQTKSGTLQTARAALMMLVLIPLAACVKPGGSATEVAICRELRADLPTWSSQDTAETLATGAQFVAVFEGVCGR